MSEKKIIIPLSFAEHYDEIQYEMDTHKECMKHLTDIDLVDYLIAHQNQGFEFDGLMEMYRKINHNKDLTVDERKTAEHWYILASQELVYDV